MKKMFKRFKEMLKEQVGFTLVELLAVIVILGIIAGIAVPAIGGVIENSRQDAHDSTAIQLIEATRLGVAAGQYDNASSPVSAATLVADGFLEAEPSDPTGVAYDTAEVAINTAATGGGTYTVKLVVGTGSTFVDDLDPNLPGGVTLSDLQ